MKRTAKIKTPIEYYATIVDIDFEEWHHSGISCLLIDVDSTLAPWRSDVVPQDIANALHSAKASGFVASIGLVTNAHAKQAARIRAIATICSADAYFMPDGRWQQKPSPFMIHRAADQFGASLRNVAFVGDKYTTDIWAARRAGVAKAGWVERLGEADHALDRYVRRPLEMPLRWGYRRRLAG